MASSPDRQNSVTAGMRLPPIVDRDGRKVTGDPPSMSPVTKDTSVPNISVSESPDPPQPKILSRRTSQISLKQRLSVNEPAKARPSFRTMGKRLVGVLKWRKTSAEDEHEIVVELPPEPRFCATLSLEAQYAMMKGYEDLLLDYLRDTYPDCAITLPRTRTPIYPSRSGKELVPYPFSKPVAPVDSGKVQDERISKERSLVITYRFQSAMDILDSVRESQGMLVTSPRFKKKKIKPIEHYGRWNNTWKGDFLAITKDSSDKTK